MNCCANIQKFSLVTSKTANFFVKKLCFPRFNKLYVPFSLLFARYFVISQQLLKQVTNLNNKQK